MMENTHPRKRRLNPFAFPPDTNGLFILLIVSAVIWTIEVGQIITNVIGASLGQSQYTAILLIIAICLLTLLIYLTHPAWIRRRKSSQPITRNDDPKFWDAVSEASFPSNISPLPNIEIGTRDRSTNAQVFGFWKNHILRVDRGLRLLFRQDREKFRAIILHELAHIANGDIARTYLTQAIWTAITFLALIPVLLLTLRFFLRAFTDYSSVQTEIILVLFLFIKIACMFLIMAGIRRNILRSRELFADQRAGIWGAQQALMEILQRNALVENQVKRTSRWGFHPSSRERLKILQIPDSLFEIRPALPFFLGILMGLTTGGIFIALNFFLANFAILGNTIQTATGILLPEWSVYFMFLVFVSPLILMITILFSNSLGIAVQRLTAANMANGNDGFSNYMDLAKAAVLLAIGFQVGSLLPVSSMLDQLPGLLNNPTALFRFSVINAIIFFLVFLTSWIVLIYLRFVSRHIVGNHVGISPPKVKIRFLSWASSLILMCFYAPIFFLQGISEGLVNDPGSLGIFGNFLLVVLFSVFVLYSVLFIATALSLWGYNSFHKRHCPSCGQITHQRYAVGQSCEHCGNELAAWLYIT